MPFEVGCNSGVGCYRRIDSSTSLSSHGTGRKDSATSLPDVEIPHNDSTSSLSSLVFTDSCSIESPGDSDRSQVRRVEQNTRNSNQNNEECDSTFYDRPIHDSSLRISLSEEEISISSITESLESLSDCGLDEEALSCNREMWFTTKGLVEVLSQYPDLKATFSELCEKYGFNKDNVQDRVSCNRNIFQINGDVVNLKPQISICSNHVSSEGCQNESSCVALHICPQYLKDKCNKDVCSLGHSKDTQHNSRVLKKFCLTGLTQEKIQKIIQFSMQNTSSGLLEFCEEYNQNSCTFANCKKLHICKLYLAGLASCPRQYCSLNHKFDEPSVSGILELHGISIHESPKDIVKALHRANSQLKVQLPFIPRVDDDHFPNTVWANYAYGDVKIPEICHNSMNNQCQNERTGCKRLHCLQPFHWQVREKDGYWLNLTSDMALWLELAFCDPEQTMVTLPQLDSRGWNWTLVGDLSLLLGNTTWEAKFENETEDFMLYSSEGYTLELRRLCSEDIGDDDVPGREFVWYYQNSEGKFILFGTEDPQGEDDLSRTTTEHLENAFKNHTGEGLKIHYTTDQFTYHIDVDSMTQVKESDQSSCKVRRRPKPHFSEKLS